MSDKELTSYNIIYDPVLTPKQVKACHFYLTPNFDEDCKPSHIVYVNMVCDMYDMTSDELAWALSKLRLYSNDITCIHCGIKYLLNEPIQYHQMPSDWENWECVVCRAFLKKPMQFDQMIDSYPVNKDDWEDDDADAIESF
ncbi:hypothetical protein GCM10010099_19480 [Streptomyces cinereus]|nr:MULTISPECIES: hypothetical protein [unclassified Moraxella]GGM03345.1 hypothetical protein GCM10010099_19480 [Streptomyces cinereus]